MEIVEDQRRVFASPRKLAEFAARRLAAAVESARIARGRALVAIPGGESPLPLFDRLAADPGLVRWSSVDLLWTDERHVPHDDPRSNFGAASRRLLDRLPMKPRVHPVPTGAAPVADAAAYSRLLLDLAPEGLDVAILGVGDDGHTAGLFPGQASLGERGRWALPVQRPDGLAGITMTYACLNRCKAIWVIATGKRKRPLLERLGAKPRGTLPISRLNPAQPMLWLVDDAAAGRV